MKEESGNAFGERRARAVDAEIGARAEALEIRDKRLVERDAAGKGERRERRAIEHGDGEHICVGEAARASGFEAARA